MVGDIMQPTHLLFVLVVALLVLGPKRLPEVGRTLGSGIRDFRQALSGESPERSPGHEAEQVPSAAHGPEHQPDLNAEDEIVWPEEAVGPATYDEPVTAASADPHPGEQSADAQSVVDHVASPSVGAQPASAGIPQLDEDALRASAEATRIGARAVPGTGESSPDPQTGSSD